MNMRPATLALLAALSLSACGGGDSEAGATPNPSDLAAQIGCEGDADEAEDKVSCHTDDAFFGITVYESNDLRDAEVDAVAAAGVTVLVGDRFMVDSSDPDALEAAREQIGGEIR